MTAIADPRTGDAHTTDPALPCNAPDVVFGEIVESIRWAIDHQPRSLQERIGPSQIGEPCDRALIAKMFGVPQPGPEELPNFRAWVGTCMHSGFETILANCLLQQAGPLPRYLLEQQVSVGSIGGVDITGHCDVFDVLSGTVVDHKSKSRSRLLEARRHGASPTNRVQSHLYGYGWTRQGYHVNTVMNIFYPRDGDLHDAFYWSEPYSELVAVAALARANRLYALGALIGPSLAMSQFPLCTGEFCRHCGGFRRPFNAPKKAQTTLAALMKEAR